jgi:hypothetical protein
MIFNTDREQFAIFYIYGENKNLYVSFKKCKDRYGYYRIIIKNDLNIGWNVHCAVQKLYGWGY